MERVEILCFILVILYLTREIACNEDNSIESNRQALLDFKNGLKDPKDRLWSWKGSNYCGWQGIICENSTKAVISVDLHNPYNNEEDAYENWSSMILSGEIRSSLRKLKSLRYLDLSFNWFNDIPIPPFFGSLKNLQYLNLSNAGFSGVVPPNIGNLSNLQHLDLSFGDLFVDNIEWMIGLVSLKHLEMNYVNISLVGTQWMEVLNKLPILIELHLHGCNLFGSISSSSLINFTSLTVIDIGYNNFNYRFPEWLLNISSLASISISNAGLQGTFPLGEVPNLQYLDLSWNNFNSTIIGPIANLCNLKYLDLSYNSLDGILLEFLNESKNCGSQMPFPNLIHLDLSVNQFQGTIKGPIAKLWHLTYLDLRNNNLSGSLLEFLNGSENFDSQMPFPNLTHLDLSSNQFQGSIPSSIGKFCNLKYVDLSQNQLLGGLPEFLDVNENCSSNGLLPNLMIFSLFDNQLSGKLPEWLGELKNLVRIDLFHNKIEGPIPASIGRLQHLEELWLGGNELNGSLPASIGNLPQLKTLEAYGNDLSGSVTSQHFSKLHKLEILDIGYNSFHLNVSSDWVPPFQLKALYMQSCHVGPLFPPWLRSQNNLRYLFLFNASISGSIPSWFWNNISFNLHDLDLSSNQLKGELPNSLNFSGNARIDFSYNFLEGPVPFLIHGVFALYLYNNNFSGPFLASKNETMLGLRTLHLSNNKITGVIPLDVDKSMPDLGFLFLYNNQITGTIPDSIGHMTHIEAIDFAHNNLSGSIPSTIHNCSHLLVLVLGHNNLSGMIPESLGLLPSLRSLHLNHNKLSGELLSSLRNLSKLLIFDLSYNKLSGNIPAWIGTALEDLMILNLRWNMFWGRLPSKLSNLSSLHVIDLAHNNLTGDIPATLVQLKAVTQQQNLIYSLYENEIGYYMERLIVHAKGQSLEYTTTLSLVVSIDLSDNSLSGEFPEEITKLFGLVALNLSRNRITGQIPGSISSLHELASLDLSSNNLSGAIPSSMASLAFLGYLNLSNNNFHGKIPFENHMTRFPEWAFAGNPNLCGDPLVVKCEVEDSDKEHTAAAAIDDDGKEDDNLVDKWFYLSVGLGFAAGLLVPYFLIAINKSWYDVYFNFVDKIACKSFLLRRKRRISC